MTTQLTLPIFSDYQHDNLQQMFIQNHHQVNTFAFIPFSLYFVFTFHTYGSGF